MNKIAFVFPGQGAQTVGMGSDFYDEKFPPSQTLYDMLGEDVRRMSFEGSQNELNKTINAQPCLFAADLAAAWALGVHEIGADGVAGFSLGEIPAMAFAGLIHNVNDAFELVKFRAKTMQACAEKNSGGMAAVMGLDTEAVAELCAKVDGTYPVNFNAPGQIVVAFRTNAQEEFLAVAKEAKARVILLKVSGAFHSPLMDEAATEMLEYLQTVKFETPKIPIYSNVTGKPYPSQLSTGSKIEPVDSKIEPTENPAELIARQINSPVQWQATIENMMNDGFGTFIEVGPGKTLTGLIKRINDEAKVFNVFDAASLESVVAQLKNPTG